MSGHYSYIGYRKTQEDRYAEFSVKGFRAYLLCDGHGSHKVAEQFTQLFPAVLSECLDPTDVGESVKAAIKKLDLSLPCKVNPEADEDYSPLTWVFPGSTLAMLLVGEEMSVSYLFNLGDSRAMLVDGNTIIETVDHSPDLPSEKERVEAVAALKDDHFMLTYERVYEDNIWHLNKSNLLRVGGINMTRALGYNNCPYILNDADVIEVPPNKGFIVLATDGLWDVMSCQELNEYISATIPPIVTKVKSRGDFPRATFASITYTWLATSVVCEAFKRGSMDNISVSVVDFGAIQAAIDANYDSYTTTPAFDKQCDMLSIDEIIAMGKAAVVVV